MLAELRMTEGEFRDVSGLDKCMIPALLRCPSRPCHSDDTGMSTKNKSPSLSVTYNGYNECTFGPRASRRFPLWSVHPPDENPTRMPSLSSCPTKIKDPFKLKDMMEIV